ncbi:MAG: LPS assembly lipoprotein LptE [Planctomycetota bacterium]|nr:LPS assembly lipoprotein LptE [Planctomycetota bacterium]
MQGVRLLLLALCGLALVVTAACSGYTTKRIDAFPAARTIAIRPVANEGFRRDLELRLHQAIADELRARTSYALATPERADLILETRMRAGEQLLVQGEERVPIQKLLEGSVDVTLSDGRGRILRADTVSAQAEFLVERYGESLDGSATDEWTRRMAIRVVQFLETGF